MNLVDTIELPNGLKMEIWNASRLIAADTVKVDLIIRIKVGLRPEYFPSPDQFELTRKIFGPEVVFEYRKERSFIAKDLRDSTFDKLLEEFRSTSLDYISKPNFPSRFALSKYMDVKKNPYKYKNHKP